MLCGGHGTCVDGVASFTCSCETGYSGELCEELGECGLRRGREEREGEGGGHAASWVCSQGTQLAAFPPLSQARWAATAMGLGSVCVGKDL